MSNVAIANDMFDTMNKAYKIAEYMSKSDIIPKHFIGKPANIFIVLNSAQRMNLDPMLVMQNTFVISGKLGMNAAFAIAMANSSGLFSGGIRYRVEENPQPLQTQIKIESKYEATKILDLTLRDIKVTAYTNIKDTGEEISYTVSMQDAIAEKWVKNEKYVSLPELMLRYRAATLLIRTHSPEVLNGLQTREELEDVAAAVAKDVTPIREERVLKSVQPAQAQSDSEIREQLTELVVSKNISADLVEKWCKKAGVSTLHEMSDDKMMACIQYILSKHTVVETDASVEQVNDYIHAAHDGTLSAEMREVA